MRSFYISVFFITCLGFKSAQAQTFVESCTEGTQILSKTLICKSQNTTFKLHKGLQIDIASQKGNQKHFEVQKIKRLQPRVTDIGFQPESIKFISSNNKLTATISIPCGQSAYAYVGLGVDKEGLPSEQVAECHIL